ncbi:MULTISPECIES: Sec-independent protein translocase protein TatB [Desulfovibrio]|jgi:sec-independent protein translocase protein TatB|uniref:Sec-independent protein translocase protein TatB n=1 Tax=Desulfovibrio TaxID=872 RepID=UPI000401E70C|nr:MULTISPECIES: Sec-independent protein translocase protein TatB [Desulfovibrio]MDY0304959.1 Sec-independent protein translocase protein TatB [Desulfovibrionaceae bacterium]HMM39503.1 Sec-independent protein translocase protein TatB [Desulfovibrio sp.]
MFGIGTTELLVILVVALIVLGPSKLPELMKSLGKGLAEFRRMSTDVKRTLDAEVEKAEMDQKTAEMKKQMFPEKPDTVTPDSAKAAKTAEAAPAETAPAGETKEKA